MTDLESTPIEELNVTVTNSVEEEVVKSLVCTPAESNAYTFVTNFTPVSSTSKILALPFPTVNNSACGLFVIEMGRETLALLKKLVVATTTPHPAAWNSPFAHQGATMFSRAPH